MLLTNWKSRLLPPELCREIDAVRSVDKSKGRIDWTITDFPPPLAPVAKNSKKGRSPIKKLLHGLKSIWKWVVRVIGLGKDSAEKKPLVKRSQLLYMQSMPLSLYAYYNDSHGLALFVRCNGPADENWNRCAMAHLDLYSADGSVVCRSSFFEYKLFTSPPGYNSWGDRQIASAEFLKEKGCYLPNGAIRVSAEITVRTDNFPMQEVLLLSIANFSAFVSANGTKVYRTSPVLLRDRPLVIEASIHDNNWLTLCFVYNDGEPIEERGDGLYIIAYSEVKRSKSKTSSFAHSQRRFTFHRGNVRQGIRQFARCTTLLDPDNGHVKEDGSIELMVIILAKDYASDDGSDEYDDDGWD